METQIPSEPPAGRHAIRSTALPLLVFSGLLMLLLLASRLLLLPRWAQVTLQGRSLSLPELREERTKLQASLLTAEETRRQAIVPETETLLASLLLEKERGDRLLDTLDMAQAAAEQSSPVPGAVRIRSAEAAAEDGTLILEGDVGLVEYASMSVLAQFVARLTELPGVTVARPPTYVREEGGSGPHSPFQITLRLVP